VLYHQSNMKMALEAVVILNRVGKSQGFAKKRGRTGQGGPRRIARRHAAPAPRLWSSPDSNRLTVCTLNVLEKMRIG
jgi:hypothetical protein